MATVTFSFTTKIGNFIPILELGLRKKLAGKFNFSTSACSETFPFTNLPKLNCWEVNIH